MNINNAMDKAWEGETLSNMAQAPISALQGLAEWTDTEFAKLGLSSIYELGTWKYFLWARALCKLSETEIPDKREVDSRMNVNNALDKAHEGKHLKDVMKLPPSALQGLAEWVDEPLAKLHVKTIQQLGTWKFAEWANAMAVMTPLEKELPPVVKPPPVVKKTKATIAASEEKTAESEEAAAPPVETAEAPVETAEAIPSCTAVIAEESISATPDPKVAEVICSALDIEVADTDLVVTAHYKLANVDVEKNMDKYIVLQTVKWKKDGDDSCHYFCTRWGRTGSRGQAKVDGPFENFAAAAELLAMKFKEKTGNGVESVAAGTFVRAAGKYDIVKGDIGGRRSTAGASGGCLWQYYVDDGVDGKKPGWYDYAKEAAEEVEGVYQEKVNNPGRALDVRCVQSGHFCYHVNFNEMKQTNVTHPNRKQRQIRRNA